MTCALTKVTPGRRPRRLGDVTETSPDKVTTNSPGRCRDVAVTSPAVATTSPQHLLSLLGLQQVLETSPQSQTKLVSATSPQLMETSPRPAGDWKKSPKKSNMFEFPTTPRRPGYSPGDVTETSPQSAETRVATRSPKCQDKTFVPDHPSPISKIESL